MKQKSWPASCLAFQPTVVAVVIASVALLDGCSTAHLSTPSIALPASYESSAAATTSQTSQALDRWWRLFDDPQLTRLIEQALVASPDAKSALERISEARAARAQTLAAYYPQGALQGSAQNQNTTESLGGLGVSTASAAGGLGAGGLSSAFITPAGDLQTYAAQFNVSYVVDLFGLQRTARRAADQDVAAARFSYEAARATLATDVATALFQARGYAIQLDDARETLRIATDLAKSGELSASHGLTSTSDEARLETDAASAKAEVDRLTAVELAARRSLLALIGRGFDPIDQLQVEAIAPPPPAAPSVAPGDLLRRRPDVRQAEAQLRSAADNLALDRLALFPSFSLTPGIQLAKTGGIYALTSSIWTVGIGASEPILDRARLLAVIRGQKARGEEAVAAYEKAVQDAYRDAENGLATFGADTKRSADLQVAEARARFAFEAKRRGYDLGLTDLTTLLEAERTWRQTLSVYNGARTTALVDAATLFQALGGGWSPEQTPAPGKALRTMMSKILPSIIRTVRNHGAWLNSVSVTGASSAFPRGPSTAFSGPPPHASHREDEGSATFISPIAKRWGSTPEGGGGRAALAGRYGLALPFLALTIAALAGCAKPGATAKGAEAQPLTVSVMPIEIKALKGGVSASGLLTPKLEAAVSTELNGYRVARVFVDQGAHVKAGQPLAQLDDTLLKSQIAQQRAIVAQQEVAAERAAAEAQRVAGLDNTGVLPEEQILERRLASRSGEAAVKAAQAQLADLMVRESLMTVRAPVGGLVLARMARPGDIAAPANAMFRIAADSVLELNAETPESELGRLHPGDAAEVTLPDGAVVTGHIRVVSPEVDAQTKLAGVRITLPVRPDLRSGGFGRANFVDSAHPAMVAPENAVRFDADGASVLVLQPDDRVRRVPVHTGVRSHGEVELLDGPAPGDKVLLGGGAFVLDGDKVHPVEVKPLASASSARDAS